VANKGGVRVSRKRVNSREWGESFVAALVATEPMKVRGVVREWAAENKEALFDLTVEGLDWQADLWEQRIAENGQEVAERMFQDMHGKLSDKFYDLVLEIVATQAKDDRGNSIRRIPIEHISPYAKSIEDDHDDWDDDDDDDGRSSNDDRSDSMNPNNDSYQDSADNRSDQMNPNNDAYGSSRR